MILTGLADEAAGDLPGQIRAHQALGWEHIELRLVDGRSVAGELSDDAFEAAAEALAAAGMTVTAFASAIGNWSRPITGDFALDRAELARAAGRMRRLGVKFIRTMSWTRGDADEAAWRDESIRRYRELARMAGDAGITLAYENCTGWASESAQRMREFFEAVDSSHMVMLYDLGNVVGKSILPPLEYYEAVHDLVGYVHLKDARRLPSPAPGTSGASGGGASGGGGDAVASTWPGEGEADAARVLARLCADGYDGVISIEPHLAAVIHRGQTASPREMYDTYLRYGRMAEALVEQAWARARV